MRTEPSTAWFAVNVPIVLSYAPVQRRSRLRLAIRALACLAVCAGLTWAGLDVRGRVRVLENMPGVGPVDWPAVLTSWTMIKAAWALSSDPNLFPLSVCGLDRKEVEIRFKAPIRYDANLVHIDIEFINRSGQPIIVPPLVTTGEFRNWGRCMTDAAMGFPTPVLGRGSRVASPGRSATQAVNFAAGIQPTNNRVILIVEQAAVVSLLVDIESEGGVRPLARWKEIPQSAMKAERSP